MPEVTLEEADGLHALSLLQVAAGKPPGKVDGHLIREGAPGLGPGEEARGAEVGREHLKHGPRPTGPGRRTVVWSMEIRPATSRRRPSGPFTNRTAPQGSPSAYPTGRVASHSPPRAT